MSDEFPPNIGCACSITDHGIHHCDFHANAESRITTLEAIVKASDDMEKALSNINQYLTETDELGEEYLTPLANEHYSEARKTLEAYRQAKERSK